MRKPPTGEPDARKPPVRFGGRGGESHSDPYHDECRIRRDNAPANFATSKHIASNLMRSKADKHSMRVKRRLAAWDDAYLECLITGAG